ncbi:hypothetical protein [Bythopirellula polymerisocia]|uniref:Uncharacterized protein n=1 Tax=Bythopirellula polymerisocia TaxID=2528003 RepID=A0A5C6CYV5_9BACT|nr:hypothetical protein [Bythopirellula polymerisocia]TWU28661.1 hypothetical protein Pla144_19530 [Bythopirellula polymerisocia]
MFRFSGNVIAIMLCWASVGLAQVPYPFDLPTNNFSATLNIDTKQKTVPVHHMLFGLNCNWPEGLYGKTGYNHPSAQKLIRQLEPSSLRFPHGVWSNFYDWESDGRRITDDYKTPYDSAVKGHPDLKYGFDGFNALHQELSFDVVFTWNVNYDSPEKGVRRLIDRRDKNFDVKWIELGNEPFWKTQRSEAISDVDKYIVVAKQHTEVLKKADPDILVSVPVHWRQAITNPWNLEIKKHRFYDAVTLHKHIRNKENRDGAAKTLAAGREMVETGEALRKVFPGRPIWVTEWSVGCGENAISILGMADVYLGMVERPDLFTIADYFQINASHALINYDKKTQTHTRTSYGAAYEIIRDIFEGSERLVSHVESTVLGDKVKAVSADAVFKNGRVTVFAINKTTKAVPLHIFVDGASYTKLLKHQAFSFSNLNELRTFRMEENVLSEVSTVSGTPEGVLLLPPLSLNRFDTSSLHMSGQQNP